MLKIRPFRKGLDEEVWVRIFNAVFTDYDDIRCLTVEEMKKLEDSPSFDEGGMLIAEWSDRPVGIVDAYVDRQRTDGKGFIQSLGVLPEYRERGIAKKLMNEAVQSLRQRGIRSVNAWAQTDKEGCAHVYESLGFKQARFTSMMKRSLNTLPHAQKNMEAKIREVQVKDDEDIELLNRLDNESFKEHNDFRPRTLEETKYWIFEMPWFNKQAWFFAVLNDQPVGHVGIAIDEGLNEEKNLKWGWIMDIGVLKPHRRIGIGTSLMLHSMKLLKTMGMKEALLYVDEMNPTEAIKLYRKLGFKVARRNIVYRLVPAEQDLPRRERDSHAI
jgi:mycothiol synthase